MRQSLALALLLMTAVTSGCTRFGEKDAGQTNQAEEIPVPVAVTEAEVATVADHVTVTGTIRAHREADVAAQIAAKVLDVPVREGDAVREGQVLITLDRVQAESSARQARAGAEAARARLDAARSRLQILEQGARPEERAIARSRLEQAEAALQTAEADLARLRGLFAQGAVSKQQLDSAQMAYDTARTNRDSARQSLDLIEKGARPEEVDAARKDVQAAAAGLDQAQAALASAEQMLSYTVIRSPLTGVVYERNVHPGEITSTMGGAPLLRLADFSSVYYEATVPERVALKVKSGQRVDVTVQGNGDRAVLAEVERLVPIADPASRDFLVRISIVDDAGLTRPGMFARGAVVVQEKPDVVVIPKTAVFQREGRPVVFVVEEDRVEARPVTVGMMDRTRAEIISGVEAREKVVVSGAEGLQDGSAVQVRGGEGD
ncbi:MAG: efflux RND transporter periplasmic adaptor subunit [Armatimonadota bacterium]|nr:MAG: efflux RND transporter periplasmic adaptor subunit [Armatimonadota bacterium]